MRVGVCRLQLTPSVPTGFIRSLFAQVSTCFTSILYSLLCGVDGFQLSFNLPCFLDLFILESPSIICAQPFDYPTAKLSTSWTNHPSAPHSVQFGDGSTVRAILLRANRDHPVKINATLKLTSDGDLVLRDADGSVAWSSGTAGKSVDSLSLTNTGNLVLLNKRKAVVWQSFDHPTDALVPGQTLSEGQKLISSVSKTNSKSKKPSYVKFLNGSLGIYPHSWKEAPLEIFAIPPTSSVQYMRLEFDGHLRVYEWKQKWEVIADLLTGFSGECGYPLACGKYSICSKGQSSKYQDFVELKDITYFTNNYTIGNVDVKKCKGACLKDCSCKAAVFRTGSDPPSRECLLLSEVFSLLVDDPKDTEHNSTVYLKVQKKAIK
ncbi:EP1-like glycoprotein 2 [Apium graveolens]|uniref:EP1-like glycoprotein 2 n=1 Tax=Apium graveolens TaxID=4045 RepID=UPI003D7B6D46